VKNGCSVPIFATNEEKLKKAQEEINLLKIDSSQKVIYKILDVSIYKKVEEAVVAVLKEFECIDILVNSAGITKDNLLLRMEEDDFDRTVAVNLKSIYNTCKVLIRPMMKNKKGKIINISSIIGIIGNAGQANYAASKAAIHGFSKSLAKEMGSRNILVNCIAPGFIETQMTDVLPAEIKNEMLKSIPLKRFGSSQDVANLALFLASDSSDYITGQVLVIDGGMI
jgi:3-oxoacyl-[acyl-carrier protein] reductase